jgi:hypothetical protein
MIHFVSRRSLHIALPVVLLLGACALPTGAPSAEESSPEVSDNMETPAINTAEETDSPDQTIASTEDSLVLSTKSLWISQAELKALPTSGAAWDKVRTAANNLSGSADLSDNNSNHDVETLAAAYVAVRTNDPAMRRKAISHIETVYTSGFARVLELSRNIQSYVIAADVIGPQGWDSARFRKFVVSLSTKPLSGHSGGKNMLETAQLSSNNWGCHARAAIALIGLYSGNSALIDAAVQAQRAFVSGVGGRLTYSGTNWHAGSPIAGINGVGSTIAGHSVDGVIAEDQRRTGEYRWPAPKGSYPWEALQGAIVAGVVLDRAGLLPFNTGRNALVRAAKWLTVTNGNPAAGDDTWQPWLLNRYGGAGLSTQATTPGKNMGYTDWTHR